MYLLGARGAPPVYRRNHNGRRGPKVFVFPNADDLPACGFQNGNGLAVPFDRPRELRFDAWGRGIDSRRLEHGATRATGTSSPCALRTMSTGRSRMRSAR